MEIRITGVRAIETAPQSGCNLVVVRVDTNQPGLYGLGCATFTQRHKAVVTAIREYMDPLLRGRNPLSVEDNWNVMMNSSYWRNGPVLNNAISGCDMALWDILGKVAGLPVYQLWGGKCREAVPVYRHASGRTQEELEDNISAYMEQGYQYLRVQVGAYGGLDHYLKTPSGSQPGSYFDPLAYKRSVPTMLEKIRIRFGNELELMHDVHERLTPIDALTLTKSLEPYRLFFLEDVLPPEQVSWFENIRSQCAVPLAMGELFNNPMEWLGLVENRLIDYIRCHVSQIGGVTPARKLANLCEPFGIRTAWHGPGDVSPIGHVANLHLDLCTTNFGIQEWSGLESHDALGEVFSGLPEQKEGFLTVREAPGWGVDIDEAAAAKYPCDASQPHWLLSRLPDGTSARA